MAYKLMPILKPRAIWCGAFPLSFFAFLLVATAPNPAVAEDFSPEQKLQAIKHALVDLALGTEISLGSAAFIDSQGVLHESSHMTTQGNIRGVRVLSYLEEAGVPIVRKDRVTSRVSTVIEENADGPGQAEVSESGVASPVGLRDAREGERAGGVGCPEGDREGVRGAAEHRDAREGGRPGRAGCRETGHGGVADGGCLIE